MAKTISESAWKLSFLEGYLENEKSKATKL